VTTPDKFYFDEVHLRAGRPPCVVAGACDRPARLGGHAGEPCAGLCASARQQPRWLLWAFVAVACVSFAVMLPISAAFVGTSMTTFNRLMLFRNWI
jgi:hypothetical protein